MAKKVVSQFRVSCYHLTLLVAISSCIGAPAQVPPAASSATPPSTTTKTLVQPASTIKTSLPRPLDYDYHDFKQPMSVKIPAALRPSYRRYPSRTPGMGAIADQRLAPPANAATPLAGAESIWSEQYEWLRHQVRKLHRHKLYQQLDALQEKYPQVNLTLLYDHYRKGGMDYDTVDSQYLYHNGTYQWDPYYGDAEDGYWFNGTYYPGEQEVPERDGGYFYNGTWYAGEQDWDEGSFYNGTYYPGEEDREDGYYYNGTFYLRGELDEEELEGMRRKGMMSPQQYYPDPRGAAINNVDGYKQNPASMYNPQQPMRKWEGNSGYPAPPLQQQYRQQPPQMIPGVPQRLPMIQQRPQPRRPTAFDRARIPNHPQQLPQLRANANNPGQQFQGIPGKSGPKPNGATNSQTAVVGNNNNPGKAAFTGNDPTKEQVRPAAPKSIPPGASWGIVFAAILGASMVLAPLACLLYKYRQQTRVKKRTFLKRPEHGSVDDGILDALVMKDLGEKKDSRVRQVDKAWGRSWKGAGKDASSYRTTYELKPVTTRTTSAHVHHEPDVSIT